jgi:hypothetical protein
MYGQDLEFIVVGFGAAWLIALVLWLASRIWPDL